MRIIRFVADDGRVLCGEDRLDGTATVIRDLRGVLGVRAAAARLRPLRGKNAVVADDDPNMRQMVCTVLEKAGCVCRSCVDGAEAKSAIESGPVDLVVSDIMMPHYNGYEIFAAARERDGAMPVLLITGFGYDPSHSLVRASAQGLQSVLYKPFTPQQLLEQLLRAMESPDGSLNGMLETTDQSAGVSSLLTPVRPSNIICVGRNYPPLQGKKPVGESSREIGELEVFMKPTTALQASGEPIRVPSLQAATDSGEETPPVNLKLDCEGELAVVVNRTVEKVSVEDAMGFVLGYTIANDITARAFQTSGPPVWMRGKGFDTFCPMGPALITADGLPDPGKLTVTTMINGKVVRTGAVGDMIRSVPQIISELSQSMTLEPGTLILTGAPPRVAAETDAAGPADISFLEPGDEVSVEIPEIGRLVNPVTEG